MRNRGTFTTAAALLGAALGLAAPARGAGPEPQAPPPVRPDGKVEVDTTLHRPLGNGCVYQAQVRGTLQETLAQAPPNRGETRYNPELRTRARVLCPGGRGFDTGTRLVRGGRFTAADVARLVELQTHVATRVRGVTCSYRPDFAFRNTTLVGMAVTPSCFW